MLTGVLLLCTFSIPVVYFLYDLIYPRIDKLFNLHLPANNDILWASISAGLLGSIKVTLIAVAITLLRRWWLKQKEKEQLEREKINAELQLLKAQIHPAFLFSTLNNIITHAKMDPPRAPGMLIKLSDLLSYMLYECDAPKVKLEKELTMLREYISLEKIRQGEKLEMTFQVKGNVNGHMISPLLLLPFIDNSFSYSEKQGIEKAWVNLNITIDDDWLHMKLINGIPGGMSIQAETEHSLFNVQKRLRLLYPERHELKINTDHELLIVNLNLKLEEPTLPAEANETSPTNLSYA